MNDALKSFSFEILLRNFFSGIFFLASFYRAFGLNEENLKTVSDSLSLLIALSLAIGLASYTLHRSILNPVYDWIHCWGWVKRLRKFCPLMSIEAVEMMIRRWDAIGPKENKTERKRQLELKKWSDYIHFLYSSSLSVLIGALVGWYAGGMVAVFDPLFFGIGIAFFLGAILSDWRRHYIEDHYLEKIEQNQSAQVNPCNPPDNPRTT